MTTQIFPYAVWESGTTQNSIPANDNSLRSEVVSKGALGLANAAPATPSDGDVHIVGTPWGAFASDDAVIYRSGNWYGFAAFAGWIKYRIDTQQLYIYDEGWQEYSGGGGGSSVVAIPIACSDEVTALTTGAAKVTFRMPYAMTLTQVRASLTTAQVSGSIFTVDINEGGASILSTKLTIDNTEKTSTTAAAPAVISDASLANDAEITIDIDQIGNSTAKGLKVYLIGTI